jgi:acylphosphatase
MTEMGALARARVLVSGRVQGVAFRQQAVDAAQRLGVTGWVRNLPDGRVEALVEGDKPSVDALVAWCRHGPRLARVDEMRVTWEPHRGEFGDFRIAR